MVGRRMRVRGVRFDDGDDFGGFPYIGYGVCVDCGVEKVG